MNLNLNTKQIGGMMSLIIVIGFVFFSLTYSDKKNNEEPIKISEKYDKVELSVDEGQVELIEPVITENTNDVLLQQDESIDELNVSEEVAFSGISRISNEAKSILQEAGVLPKDLSQEAYVEFDLDSLRKLEAGDTYNLEIPQTSEMFSAEVTKIEEFSNGDKSVFGRLIGSDGVFHTNVLTVGQDAVYGQFTTASGNYVFESKGKYGWLAAKRDLYKKHVEFEAVHSEASLEGSGSVIVAPPKN